MSTKNISITSASFLALSFLTAQAASPKSGGDATVREARATLKEIDHRAMVVADQADQLARLNENTQFSPEVQIGRLDTLKGQVNRMVQEANSLEAEHDLLAPWEQRAVDKTEPLLNDAAMKTQKAIEFFSTNRNLLWTAEYRGYANEIRKDSEQIAKTLKDYLKYERVSGEEQQLKQMLGAPGE